MNFLKNILIVQKTSKFDYLTHKYGADLVRNSSEFKTLKESMENHKFNCEKFVNILTSYPSQNINLEILNDDFLNNEKVSDKFLKNKYDLIFSLGGDGTFLRSAHFIKDNKQILIGINTDTKYSRGFYCPLSIEECINNNNEILLRILQKNFVITELNKIEIEVNKNKYYFLNDLYFGEKFMGRISKYGLGINHNKKMIIKSSDLGYSGWIRNANLISFTKFQNLIEKTSQIMNQPHIVKEKILEMYNENNIPKHEDTNSVFYFIREPNLKPFNNGSIDEYIDYLHLMEGSANSISLENFCYEGCLILDGSFEISVNYNDVVKIQISNEKISTFNNFKF